MKLDSYTAQVANAPDSEHTSPFTGLFPNATEPAPAETQLPELTPFWGPNPDETQGLPEQEAEPEGVPGEEATPTDEIESPTEGMDPDETESLPADTEEPVISVEPPEAHKETGVTLPLWSFIAMCALICALIGAIALMLSRRRTAKKRDVPAKTAPTAKSGARHELLIANTHNIGRRSEQQDYFGISNAGDEKLVKEHGVLAVLADGMGGMTGGAQISQLVVKTFLEGFPGEGGDDLLERLTLSAQRNVLNYLNTALIEGGSTLVAVWLKGDTMRFVSVGDSRLCIIRNGTMTKLNKEHNYGVQLDALAEKGHISVEEAQSDPQRAALTSYIGKPDKLETNVCRTPLRIIPGDRILLMSDGVFNTLTDEEIVAALGDGLNSNALEAAVLEKARRNQDNFTAVMLQLT